MTDAALTVAQIVAPPRPPQYAQPDSSGDAESGDSDFGAVLQSGVDAQTAAPTKSNSAKSGDTPNATESQTAKSADDSATASTTEGSKPASNSKSASSTKADNKTDNKADDKKDIAGSTDANILLVLQAQPNAAQTVKTATPTDGEPTTSDAPQSNAAPAIAQSTAPSPADIAAALAPLATSAGSTAAAEQPNTQQSSTPASKGQQSEAKPSGAPTATQTQIDLAASVAAPIAQATQAQSAPIETASSASGEQVADPASTQGTNTPKKGNAPKGETASTDANTLLGILAGTGSSDAKAASNANPDASGTNDGKSETAVVGASSSAASTDKPQPAVPGGIMAKTNAAQEPFDPKTKTLAAMQQQANALQPMQPADSAAASAPNSQSATTPENTQTPAQPAVPAAQGQTQNQAFITANIVQTTAAPASPTSTLHAQMDGPRLTLPTDQIALAIRRHQFAGSDHFNIKIDPPELGRIDVKIEMTSDGQTKAHLTADRQDTLDLLQRDSGHLERALNSNGLRTDKDSLNFSLRQDNQPGRGGNGTGDGSQGRGAAANTYYGSDEELIDVAPVYARIADPTRIDILI